MEKRIDHRRASPSEEPIEDPGEVGLPEEPAFQESAALGRGVARTRSALARASEARADALAGSLLIAARAAFRDCSES